MRVLAVSGAGWFMVLMSGRVALGLLYKPGFAMQGVVRAAAKNKPQPTGKHALPIVLGLVS
jgi:hypothetical protein